MFIITPEKINNEFASTSWEKDFNHYNECLETMAIGQIAAHDAHESILAKPDEEFMDTFAETMNDGIRFAIDHADAVAGYYGIKASLIMSDMTPEEFDYVMLGNMKSKMLSYETSLDLKNNDIGSLASYGYVPKITKLVNNGPHTVLYCNDGTKTIVTHDGTDNYDIEKGVLMVLLKKAYGSRNLQHILKLLHAEIDESVASKTLETKDNSDISPETSADSDTDSDALESVNIDDWNTDENN